MKKKNRNTLASFPVVFTVLIVKWIWFRILAMIVRIQHEAYMDPDPYMAEVRIRILTQVESQSDPDIQLQYPLKFDRI